MHTKEAQLSSTFYINVVIDDWTSKNKTNEILAVFISGRLYTLNIWIRDCGGPKVLEVRIACQASYQYLPLDWKEFGYYLKVAILLKDLPD